jgi:hypothetical protein
MEAAMTIPFGPQLIGETEKTLGAVLTRSLAGTGLTEPSWVTLRVAELLDGTVDHNGLVAAVADRAHFAHADELVRGLTDRGLLDDGQLSHAGREVIDTVRATIDTASLIWDGFDPDDIAATTRVLNELRDRARAVLA